MNSLASGRPVSSWKDSDREKLRDFAASQARKYLLEYARICDPTWQPSAIHRKLAEILQAAIEGKGPKRLGISTPPQHGKSRVTSVEAATWYLGRYPRNHVVIASYAATLAGERSLESRERFRHPMFGRTFPDVRLSPMKATSDYWATNKWGTFKAVGVGGSLTGRPADLVIIDDPFKDYAEAHSPTQRQNVWNWFQSVVMTRIKPTSIIIVMQTRWHIDDLLGRLLDPARQEASGTGEFSERYTSINIPALCEDPATDPLSRTVGESSWPERYPKGFYEALRNVTLPYIWGSLYQGKPVKMGGNYCDPEKMTVIDPEQVPAGMYWARGWDLAATEDKKNDFTAGVKAAMGPPPNWRPSPGNPGESPPLNCLYLAEMQDFQKEWPEARERIKNTATLERIEVGIEAVAGFKTAYQNLVEVMPNNIAVKEIGVDKDKLTRALPWFAMMHNRAVYVVRGEWINRFKEQLQQFPDGAHDDMVDAVSIAYGLAANQTVMMLA